MKKIMTVIISLVIAITGFIINADNPGQAEKKTYHQRKMQHKQMDDVDKLLMIVCAREKMQNPKMMKMRKHGKKMSKGCSCSNSEKCNMRKKGDRSKRAGKSRSMGHGSRKMRKSRMLKAYLMENHPKEMAEIIALKKSNDKAMKDVLTKLKKIVDEARTKMKAEREQFVKMLEEYKKSKDPKLAEQIKSKLSTFYDKRLELMKKRIDEDAVRVKKAYDKLKEKKANKDKEIAEKLEKMIK
jgi:hypothetical protein